MIISVNPHYTVHTRGWIVIKNISEALFLQLIGKLA